MASVFGGNATPSASSFKPTFAFGCDVSTRWSQHSSSTQPPAIAWPLAAQTIGPGYRYSASTSCSSVRR
jgi:hypothetical protein